MLNLFDIPSCKTVVRWSCADCGTECESIFEGLLRKERGNKLSCRSCSISKSRGGAGYKGFTDLLESEGWTMKGVKEQYKNTKSLLEVECNRGHQGKASYNHFSAGHRCKECDNETKRRHTVESVSIEFEEHGFKLLATDYINNSTDMPYICKCGRQGHITYTNFTKNLGSCNMCTRRWTINEVLDYFTEYGCFLSYAGTKEYVFSDEYDFETEGAIFNYRTWPEFILNDTYVAYVCTCGNFHRSTWRLFKNGARCLECTKERIRNTCLEIYGVDNPAKSEEVKKKIVETFRSRYGVDHAMQLEETIEKARTTNMENHGGVHNLNLPETRASAEAAFLEKYGNTIGNVPEMMQKTRDTNNEIYGCDYPFQNEEILRKALAESYGVKDYIFPSGRVEHVRGYEPFMINDILKEGIEEDDIIVGDSKIPIVKYTINGKLHSYYPDCLITSTNTIIEVKSDWTYDKDYDVNMVKFKAVVEAGYNMELRIYSKTGKMEIKQTKF